MSDSSSSSDIDFDAISANYVLECVQSGGVLDVSKATAKYIDESMLPAMIHSKGGHAFFLLSEPDSAGSPPQRAPPSVETNYDRQHSSIPLFFSNGSEATVSGYDLEANRSHTVPSSSKSAKKTHAPSIGLPDLRTGLSDDDLRESAYEVLLSCIAFSGIAIHSSENPKKDKGSRFLTGLKSRRGKRHLRSHSVENQFEHIDNIRVQLQISEAMDECIRQRLMQFSIRKSHGQVDIPQIVIELLSGIQQNEFLVERSYTQWRKRQVWEPLSNQQRQAASVVEVFRIVEETVDQFFGLNLPMDISHLQALLSIFFHALDGYLQNLVNQLVDKNRLFPAAPPLTRYKETMFPIVKKKMIESVLLDEEVDEKLKGLTTAKLCVRLNTLEYMQKQINILEDGIKKSWASIMVSGNSKTTNISVGTTNYLHSDSESVDELFIATFNSIRDSTDDAIRKFCDLV
ncbi:hypothetical protein R6Q57_007204, partial [Mikania cordata]